MLLDSDEKPERQSDVEMHGGEIYGWGEEVGRVDAGLRYPHR